MLLFRQHLRQLILLSSVLLLNGWTTFMRSPIQPVITSLSLRNRAGMTTTFLSPKSEMITMPMKNESTPLLGSQEKPTTLPLSYTTTTSTIFWTDYSKLGFFLLIFSFNQLCRQLIYYFCDFTPTTSTNEPDLFRFINQDLSFSKEQYATVASFGFTVFFIIASFFAGITADRCSRNTIVAVSCLLWSVITAGHSRITSYSELLPLRAALGITQAFLNPAIYSLIAEIFPPTFIGTANGIYSGGIYVGGGLASLAIFLDQQIGWRSAFLVIGILGIFLAVLAPILIPEPRRTGERTVMERSRSGSSTAGVISEIVSDLKGLLSNPVVVVLLLASMCRFVAGFTIAIWKAPFIFQQFPHSHEFFAGSNAFIITVGGLFSTFFGGWLSDSLYHRDSTITQKRAMARSWIPAIGSLLAIPLWVGFMTIASSPSLALWCLFGEYLVAECWFGPTLASLFQIIPSRNRGLAQSLFAILTGIGNVGPLLVSKMVTALANTNPSFLSLLPTNLFPLQVAMMVIVSLAYLLSGGLFWWVASKEQQLLDQQRSDWNQKEEIEQDGIGVEEEEDEKYQEV